ncbi:alkaline phosphatase family protein [Halorubrum depositum]|uniref:alkaline phosphatase family protein n=1 Tax=Halorubrum depositum TaxID=2583992 RepID=UPI0011A72A7B|nr:alkaline phosphatase family protein [Halorubrum depositum]
MTASEPERAFVLGLDGVPWSLVEKWMDEGDLPTFERLRREGAAGPFASTVPANTPVAWPSIATGCDPAGHGLFEFMKLNRRYGQRPNTGADRSRPAIWDIVSPAVVGNVPMTFPAREFDGEMATGMMTPEDASAFTYPPELGAAIDRRIPDYEIGLDWKEYFGRREAFLDALDGMLSDRRELMRVLLERTDWTLSFFVYTAPDRLQHLIWDEAVLKAHYEELDDLLAEVVERCEEAGAVLFVVSDHGFGPVSRQVNVNEILRREGLIARQEQGGVRGVMSTVGFDKDDVLAALKRVGVDEGTLVRYLPEGLISQAATRIPGDHALYDADFSHTEAFLHGLGSVYVNDTERFASGTVPPSEVPAVKRRVTELLENVRDPETGDRPLVVVDPDRGRAGADGTGDEKPDADGPGHEASADGDTLEPDLLIESIEGYTVNWQFADEPFTVPQKAADHESEGIFFAHGPGIEAESRPADASAVDLVPTLLHLLDRPVPSHADGGVIEEILAAGSPAAERPVRTAEYDAGEPQGEVDGDFDEVEDRLRGLGYME